MADAVYFLHILSLTSYPGNRQNQIGLKRVLKDHFSYIVWFKRGGSQFLCGQFGGQVSLRFSEHLEAKVDCA